jgi:tetratricopeptide (TPR) repeat protein
MSINALHAQSRKQKGLLKLAQLEYKNLRFAYAIPVFKQYLLEQNKDSTVLLQIGNCYQKVNQYDSAIKYFELAVAVGVQYNSNMAEL